MAIVQANRFCKFVCVIDVPQTIQTGLGATSWNWSNKSLMPVRSFAYWDTVNLLWVGVQGTVFDKLLGNTAYTFGDITKQLNGNWRDVQWDNATQKLYAPVSFNLANSGAGQDILGLNVSCPIGGGAVVGAFAPTLLFNVPPVPATNTTWSGDWGPAIVGGIPGREIYWVQSLSPRDTYWNDANGTVLLTSPSAFTRAVGTKVACQIPYQNLNWFLNNGTILNQTIIQSSFSATDIAYNVTYESPDGVFDVTTVMTNLTNLANTMSSPIGFVTLQQTIVQIFGTTFTGYGILTSPDGLKYWILRITPDNGWRTNGFPAAKIDQNNYVFIKSANQQDRVYVASTPLNLQPQITLRPPVLPVVCVPHNPGFYR